MNKENDGDSEKLLSPPPYESISPVQQPVQQHVQQQFPPVVVNNTTVVQLAPVCTAPIAIVDRLSFSKDTPRPVRRAFIR